jgi:predicted phage terminase large subunit-like protein
MGALQFVNQENYSALLLRNSYADLTKPEGLIPRAFSWLAGTDAVWSGATHQWRFPKSNATLSFGYLEHSGDIYQYRGAAYQYCGFDELTNFREFDYRYLFSRLRRLKGSTVPIRMRSGSNPGSFGHEWVRRRFITEGKQNGRYYIPARLQHNPHLDYAAYVRTLSELDPITRAQLLNGDWTVRQGGSIFKREWFIHFVEEAPQDCEAICRAWDLAATEAKEGEDPDWTCGTLLAKKKGQWFVCSVDRFRGSPKTVEARIKQRAMTDPEGTKIRLEQEPGAAGKSLVDHYARNVLAGYDFAGVPSMKDKITRAAPFSSAAEAGNVILVRANWNSVWLDEFEAFREDCEHDDQIDSSTLAMSVLKTMHQFQAEAVPTVARQNRPSEFRGAFKRRTGLLY